MLSFKVPDPAPALPTIVQVWLDVFLENQAIDESGEDFDLDSLETQRRYSLLSGAKSRARDCGMFLDHGSQAAALMIAWEELNDLINGCFSVGELKLDDDEKRVLIDLRATLEKVLPWHLSTGGAALVPIARWMQLMPHPKDQAAGTTGAA